VEHIAVVGEAFKRAVNVANTSRQVKLIGATVEHGHLVAGLHKSSDDVAADEPCAA
jgi:hypothetical protein